MENVEEKLKRISNSKIDTIGKHIRSSCVSDGEMKILEEWRARHFPVMNEIHDLIEDELESFPKITVVQRLKRMPTILDKIKNRESSMGLSRMQDVGGVRVIAENLKDVYKAENKIKKILAKYELESEDDYIKDPKESGYRGIHLVYKYASSDCRYDKLRTEIQIRTKAEHAWATSIETVGLMRNENLKSGKGSKNWLEFFVEMSKLIAITESDRPTKKNDLMEYGEEAYAAGKRVDEIEKKNDIIKKLKLFNLSFNVIERNRPKNDSFFVISIDKNWNVVITGFKSSDSVKSVEYYNNLEKDDRYIDKVLVGSDNIEELKRAYPNYFSDMSTFINYIESVKKLVKKP